MNSIDKVSHSGDKPPKYIINIHNALLIPLSDRRVTVKFR